MKKIVVVGTGYVGLVTGACLAEMGNQVVCLDTDLEKVESLLKGQLPFFEPGLEEVVVRCVGTGRLSFTDSYQEAIPGSDICFLCLPTPSNQDDSCDLSYLLEAAEQLANAMDNQLIVVNKSTVPVGTASLVKEAIAKTLQQRGVEIPFEMVSNPEFLREGSAVADCMHPDRILIGVESQKGETIMRELYAPFSVAHDRVLVMGIASAELSKYAANAMLASRLSMMNFFAELCDQLGANIDEVRVAIGADQRIGYDFLNPGIGFGGSCLPKDVKALLSAANASEVPASLLSDILDVNRRAREQFFERVIERFGSLTGKTVTLWGLSFKPDTDDLREAPSLYLIQRLLEEGANVRLYDPVAMPKAKLLLSRFEQVLFCKDEVDAAQGSDAILLVTEWNSFRFADFEKIGSVMRSKVFFDGRGQQSEKELKRHGFEYFSMGRPSSQEMSFL